MVIGHAGTDTWWAIPLPAAALALNLYADLRKPQT